MKKINTLLGFALCLSFVSFAPKSLLTDGRAPASGDEPTTTVRTQTPRHQLYVFGPLVIYKRTDRIEEVRTEYRRLQADVELIAKQKAEIERLMSDRSNSLSEVARLKKELKKVTAAHEKTKQELETLKAEFETERAGLLADIEALNASNVATEAEKQEALALLEAERALAQNLSIDIDNLKAELEQTKTELAETKEKLEEAQAEIVAKEEELERIKCENEDALATLKRDIKKIEDEKDELDRMMISMQEDYEAQLAQQQMQNQSIMMAMANFSFQALQSPMYNPYLQQSSLFDPNYQMLHMQQAQLLNQMYRQQYAPGITNNYYGQTSFLYGSGSDFMTQNPLENNHYSMFADASNMNSSRMPSSTQPSMAPGYFVF